MSAAVLVVPTGTANLASVEAALARAGHAATRTVDPDAVRRAERVVLPGVGTFAAAMDRLLRGGLAEALVERIADDRPTLAICVGMQVLARASEESPGVDGLGVFPVTVRRFDGGVRVPQIGWNVIQPEDAPREPGWVYFANSYAMFDPPGDGWRLAWATHGRRFVAAASRGAVLACQFHPELSGRYGADRIERWLGRGAA